MPQTGLPMPKLDHAASLISSDAASTRKATLQQRTTNRKSINTGYNVLFLRRKVASICHYMSAEENELAAMPATSIPGDLTVVAANFPEPSPNQIVRENILLTLEDMFLGGI